MINETRKPWGVAPSCSWGRALGATILRTERHVRFDPISIGLIDFSRLGHVPLALGALGGH